MPRRDCGIQRVLFMKFSVLIPVYNASADLERCIESVIRQSCKDFEIVLLDDGSRDSSGEICDKYAARYDNIFSYHQENRGTITTRNNLAGYARGDYCIYVDADDYLDGDALKILADTLDGKAADCVIFGMARIKNGVRIAEYTEDHYYEINDRREFLGKVLNTLYYNSLCRKCIKTEHLQKFDSQPFRAVRIGEDLVHSLHVYKNCRKVVFIPDVLYYYVMNPMSTMNTVNEKNFRPSCTLYRIVMDFLEDEGVCDRGIIDGIRAFYGSQMTIDIMNIAWFGIAFGEKVARIRKIAEDSRDILECSVSGSEMGKRFPLFVMMRKKMYSACMALACLIRFKSKIMAKMK